MLEYYYAAMFGLGPARGLVHSALPHAPVQPEREDHPTARGRRQEPASPAGTTAEVAAAPAAAEPEGPEGWDPCPCGQWGVDRSDHHGCLALCQELFPQLDQELDAWEAAHGWLYR
jgi:hypothetical protein